MGTTYSRFYKHYLSASKDSGDGIRESRVKKRRKEDTGDIVISSVSKSRL